MRKPLLAVVGLVLLAACTSVDQTEHCVLTRYGKVEEEKMENGLNFTPFSHAECFTLRDQNFPAAADSDHKETITAQTRDPLTVTGDIAIVYSFDPNSIPKLYLEKRTQDAAELVILNAVRDGYRSALASWSVADIFSARRGELSDSVRAHIQRKLTDPRIGNLAIIKQVFVRDIKVPEAIESARIASTQQAQRLAQAQQQLAIDSMHARGNIITAEAQARANQLTAQSYSSNPKLLDLEIAKALSNLCGKSTTCVIGASPNALLGVK
jgi:regulator of protease activity HflC (stomatin/prohibitin superfamily)